MSEAAAIKELTAKVGELLGAVKSLSNHIYDKEAEFDEIPETIYSVSGSLSYACGVINASHLRATLISGSPVGSYTANRSIIFGGSKFSIDEVYPESTVYRGNFEGNLQGNIRFIDGEIVCNDLHFSCTSGTAPDFTYTARIRLSFRSEGSKTIADLRARPV